MVDTHTGFVWELAHKQGLITPPGSPENAIFWGERRQESHSFLGLPQIWNLWEEEEAQPLHLLQSNLIMDCRFRRSGVVSTIATSLPNTKPNAISAAKVILPAELSTNKMLVNVFCLYF